MRSAPSFQNNILPSRSTTYTATCRFSRIDRKKSRSANRAIGTPPTAHRRFVGASLGPTIGSDAYPVSACVFNACGAHRDTPSFCDAILGRLQPVLEQIEFRKATGRLAILRAEAE